MHVDPRKPVGERHKDQLKRSRRAADGWRLRRTGVCNKRTNNSPVQTLCERATLKKTKASRVQLQCKHAALFDDSRCAFVCVCSCVLCAACLFAYADVRANCLWVVRERGGVCVSV